MRFYLILLCAVFCAGPALAQSIPADSTSAVILVYHRIGEDEYPGSNLRVEQFNQQMNELANGSYNVRPLPEIIAALKAGTPLPDHTIAITFEGAYKSLLQNAIPLLKQKNFPYTVFYASGMTDTHASQYMDWNDLKTLRQDKNVTLGLMPASYAHYTNQPRETLLADINKAKLTAREKLGTELNLFSYPFGEYDPAYQVLVKEQGFTAAFGLQSGVAYTGSDLYALPRFTMTESYGDLERFDMVANALPLPVTHIEPENPILSEDLPLIGFTIDESLKAKLASLSCFITGQSNLKLETVSDTRIELRLSEPLLEERNRINCTIPVVRESEDPRWRWFGMVLMNKVEAEDPIEANLQQDELQ